MSPQPPPLVGWSGWRWAGLVLIGTSPEGREYSLGEVFKDRDDGGIYAVLNHPNGTTTPIEARVGTVQFARKTVMGWVEEHGGVLAVTGPEGGRPESAPVEPTPEVDDGVGPVVEATEVGGPPLGRDRRAARIAMGLTQDALARLVQVPGRTPKSIQASISQAENGTRCSATFLAALDAVLFPDNPTAE